MPDRANASPDTPVATSLTHRAHLMMGRAALAVKARLRRPVSLGVRLLALNADGRVLLVRHSYLPGLALPGGGVDPGESCVEAALREAREEANLKVPGAPELFHVYFNRGLANRDHVILFVARGAWQTAAKAPGAEILAAGFHDPAALPDDTTRATRERISEVLGGRAVSDLW